MKHQIKKSSLKNNDLKAVEMYVHGLTAYEAGDPGRARIKLNLSFKSDNPLAMYYLGEMCREDGDRKGAKSWYERAAKLGNSVAIDKLSVFTDMD